MNNTVTQSALDAVYYLRTGETRARPPWVIGSAAFGAGRALTRCGESRLDESLPLSRTAFVPSTSSSSVSIRVVRLRPKRSQPVCAAHAEQFRCSQPPRGKRKVRALHYGHVPSCTRYRCGKMCQGGSEELSPPLRARRRCSRWRGGGRRGRLSAGAAPRAIGALSPSVAAVACARTASQSAVGHKVRTAQGFSVRVQSRRKPA